MKFDEIKNIWLDQYEQEENTRKNYSLDLNSFKNYLDSEGKIFLTVSFLDMTKYVSELKKKYKPATIQRKITATRLFYQFLVDCGEIEKNPCNNLKLPKVKNEKDVYLTLDEAMRVLEYIKNRPAKPGEKQTELIRARDYSIIYTTIKLGFRASEIYNMKLEDIDLKNGYFTVRDTKNGEDHTLRDMDSLKYYKEYLEMRKKYEVVTSELAYTTNKGNKLNCKDLNRIIKKYCKELGFRRNITFHSLRHSCGYLYINQGGNVVDLMYILHHKNLRTTQRYTHSNKKDIEKGLSYSLAK